jgi:prevent-host-death family protein
MTRKPSATIAAGEFKAKCLALLDEVQQTQKEYVITKRGKPVARLVPAEPRKKADDVFGRLKGTGVIIRGDIFSTGERWEADE